MYNAKEQEERISKYWEEHKCFEKSVNERPENRPYVFYDGPPFATGLPHYGHIMTSFLKDAVPRFWTMRGYRVERKWGWDCHGLPIENIIEKDLNLKSKKDIEDYGIGKFNEACSATVLKYATEWKKTIRRIGRWVDMEADYKTMDIGFMESVWWVFKELWDKKLIYEGHKAMHICPRCVTPLSNFEVTQNYKDVKDISVTVKFKVKSQKSKVKSDEELFILAWTTTPWTLPGNVLLAVNEDIGYWILDISGEKYIVAADRVEKVLEGKEYKKVGEMKGKDLVGLEYEPLFPYYKDTPNAFRVVGADFVTTTDGTGIVHIAPAFGDDDYQVGLKEKIPLVQHVTMEGKFTPEVKDFAGQEVKPADDPSKTDVEIIKWLAHNNKLFSKQKVEHSYPHCWRCDTPLLNYATSSWFVKVSELKDQMLKNNEEINWVPEHIKEGRFGEWLKGARDWAISRSRYWGTPLPVWRCENQKLNIKNKKCDNVVVVGSAEELSGLSKKKMTKLIFVRHGQSDKDVLHIRSRALDKHPLTAKGRSEVKAIAGQLKGQVDIIISSPVLRAKQSAEILAKELDLKIISDDLITEYDNGEWEELSYTECKQRADYKKYKEIGDLEQKFNYRLGTTGESRSEIVVRIKKFIDKILTQYSGKRVMVVSHGGINSAIGMIARNDGFSKYFAGEYINNATPVCFYLNEDGKEFNLHKHIVDDIVLKCDKCGGEMRRVPEVLDCWFESGSMPYGQMHYPFENKKKFEAGFPAEFIGESQDQTRGWFYTLHVLATALTSGKKPSILMKKSVPAFKNVIVSGIILAEDGKKMSKRLKNYPEPEVIMDKYGADAMRYYLATSPVMEAESLNFSETGVREAYNKVINTLWNVLEFYKMFVTSHKSEVVSPKSVNVLDRWILAKLNLLIAEVTKGMEEYKLAEASRPIGDFITELSQWYVRRSRDRFKGVDKKDKEAAMATLQYVLLTLSKVMAPFTPFIAEVIYSEITATMKQFNSETARESVHLEDWPKVEGKADNKILEEMNLVRKVVELGLSIRAEKGIKVRQPLAKLAINNKQLTSELLAIIAEELNVKEIEILKDIKDIANVAVKEDGELKVGLDIAITEDLKKEGILRELVRAVNQKRKEMKLTVADKVEVVYQTDNELVARVFEDLAEEIKSAVLADNIGVGDDQSAEEIEINGAKVRLAVKRINA